MAMWGPIRTQIRRSPPIKMGGGINKSVPAFDISPGEASDSNNTSSRNFPALSVRKGRTAIFPIPADGPIISMGEYLPQFIVIHQGESIKRYVIRLVNGDVDSWVSSMTDLELATITDSKIFTVRTDSAIRNLVATNTGLWDVFAGTLITDAPAGTLYAMDDFRLYAALNNNLYCSEEGSYTGWTSAQNGATTIPLSTMSGSCTSIVTYNDKVIVWSDQTMLVLYGNDPLDFTMSDPIQVGCPSRKTPIIHNGILYFLDFGRFMVYTQDYPVEISQKVRPYLENIKYTNRKLPCTGQSGKYIYLSIPHGNVSQNNLTLEYDTEHKTWYVYNVGYKEFINLDEGLYGLGTDNAIWKLNDGEGDTHRPYAYVSLNLTPGSSLWSDGTDWADANTWSDSGGSSNWNDASSWDDGGFWTESGGDEEIPETSNVVSIPWHHTTGVLHENTVAQKKTISEIWMTVDLPVGSSLNVAASTRSDGSDFFSLADVIPGGGAKNIKIPISTQRGTSEEWSDTSIWDDVAVDGGVILTTEYKSLQNVDWYRLKFSGFGPCTIHAVEPYYRIKSR
jgi:hypothetical protein